MTYSIILPDTRRVSEFVGIANKYRGEIRAVSGKYTANAKSIMGMLTLDLSKKVTIEIDDKDSASFAQEIESFIVK